MVNQADARQEISDYGELKSDPKGQQQLGREREIFSDPDSRPDTDGLIVLEKKAVSKPKDDCVAKPGSQEKEQGPEEDEATGVLFLVLVEARGDKLPGLPEDNGEGQENRCDEGDLDLGKERVRDPCANEAEIGSVQLE